MSKAIKTEHNGAKNGGGYWGLRVEAKLHSKKVRRRIDKLFSRVHYKAEV